MLEGLRTRVSAWNRYNRTVSQLSSLPNRDLADIGVLRADIRRAAKEAAR